MVLCWRICVRVDIWIWTLFALNGPWDNLINKYTFSSRPYLKKLQNLLKNSIYPKFKFFDENNLYENIYSIVSWHPHLWNVCNLIQPFCIENNIVIKLSPLKYIWAIVILYAHKHHTSKYTATTIAQNSV